MGEFFIVGKNGLTKYHLAYIQNAYRELERRTTRKQLDALNMNASQRAIPERIFLDIVGWVCYDIYIKTYAKFGRVFARVFLSTAGKISNLSS